MKIKTPIQEMIDFFNEKKLNSDSIIGKLLYDDFLNKLNQLKIKEKRLIVSAYEDGVEEQFNSPENGEVYYNENFK